MLKVRKSSKAAEGLRESGWGSCSDKKSPDGWPERLGVLRRRCGRGDSIFCRARRTCKSVNPINISMTSTSHLRLKTVPCSRSSPPPSTSSSCPRPRWRPLPRPPRPSTRASAPWRR